MISQKKPSSSQPAVKNRQVIIKKQCSIYSFFSTLDFVAGDLIYPFFLHLGESLGQNKSNFFNS